MMGNEDIAHRASHARHYLLATGQSRHGDAITELLAQLKHERRQRRLAEDNLRTVERAMDDASKELKRVATLLGLAPGTDILGALYSEVEALKAQQKVDTRPSQEALDTAFEAMAKRLEEVLEDNAELTGIIEKQSAEWTTSPGAVCS